MTNFALTTSSSPQAVIQSLNYALSNLGSTTGNILTVNSNGSVTNGSGSVYSYLYQYLWVAYSTSPTGANFSFSPTNATYYGLRNNQSSTPSSNPADYTWTQVAGGFGTTKSLWYITYGGGQINFSIDTVNPGSGYASATNSIDLHVITAVTTGANSTSITSSINPSQLLFTPNAGTANVYTPSTQYMVASFSNVTTTAKANISATIDTGGNVFIAEIAVDPTITVTTNYSNTASNSLTINFTQNTTGVSATGIVIVQINGETGGGGISTYSLTAYTLANTTPATPTANTGSWNFATGTGTPPISSTNTWTLNTLSPTAQDAVYSSTTIAITSNTNPTANVTTLTWSNPVLVSQVGAPILAINYPQGQYVIQTSTGWSPNAVANVVTLTANVQAIRSNVILAAVTQDLQYFTANGAYNVVSQPGTGFNANALSISPTYSSQYNAYQDITYADNGGTATNFISVALIVNGSAGNVGPAGTRGPIPLAFVVTTGDPTTASDSTLTGWFQSSRSATTPPIGMGLSPITGDTAQFFDPNVAVEGGGITAVKTFNSSASPQWTTVNGQVISGNVLYTGTVTANQMDTNSIFTLTLQSTNAQVGNVTSHGFWLDSAYGDARFAGNISIGDNLSVGNNAIFGNNVIIGNNLFIGNSATIDGLTLNGNLLDGVVSTNNIKTGSITANLMTANAITAGTIAANAVTVGTISANAISSYSIQANAIVAGAIAANAVTAGVIAANAVVTGTIAANTVTTTNLIFSSATGSASLGPNLPGLYPVTFYNNTAYWPNNTRGFAIENGLIYNPTTTGNTSQNTRLLITYSGYVFSANAANLVELWKSGGSTYYVDQFYSVTTLAPNPSESTLSTDAFYAVGSNGYAAYSYNNGLSGTWTTEVFPNNSEGYVNTQPLDAASGFYNYSSPTLTPTVYMASTKGYMQEITSNAGVVGSVYGFVANVGNQYSSVYSHGLSYTRSVGQNGIVYIPNGSSNPIESTPTINTLYGIDYQTGPNSSTTTNVISVAVGANGTIIRNTYSAGTYAGSGWVEKLSGVITNLNAVKCNWGTVTGIGNLWVAVGDYGVILTSSDGNTWTKQTSPTSVNLVAVTYGNGYWVAVGPKSTIVYSTDSINWTAMQGPAGNDGVYRNLYSVTFGEKSNCFIATGDSIIMRSTNPSTWTTVVDNGASETSTLTLLAQYGSNSNIANVSVPPANQLLGSQVISGNYIDYNYTAGIPVTYYLVMGNLTGNAIETSNPTLQVTEFKR